MKKSIAIIAALILFPALTFAQDAGKKKAYFFYLDSCPHCHNVNDYFNANGIYERYDIKKIDAQVPQNGEFLMKLYEANGYPEDQRGGVPVVAFGDKFFVGDKPIIDNFVNEIEIYSNADQLPNPDKSGAEPNIVVHDGPISAGLTEANSRTQQQNNSETGSGGNKKNYFPVIIAALIVVGAGALIFANRKS